MLRNGIIYDINEEQHRYFVHLLEGVKFVQIKRTDTVVYLESSRISDADKKRAKNDGIILTTENIPRDEGKGFKSIVQLMAQENLEPGMKKAILLSKAGRQKQCCII